MKTPADPGWPFGYNAKRLQQTLRSTMDGRLAGFGLSAPQCAVLALLAYEPGITNAELARRSFVTPPTMIRIVAGLERDGLVVRAPGDGPGRGIGTHLTEHGREVFARATAVLDEVEAALAEAAGEHREVILAWLAKASAAMDAMGG